MADPLMGAIIGSFPSCPSVSLPKLSKGQKISAGVGSALAVILALGAAALVMHTQGNLMSTLAQIKATAVTAATATGALATKVAAFVKANYHYFIAGGAAAVIIGLGIGAVVYDRRNAAAKPPVEE